MKLLDQLPISMTDNIEFVRDERVRIKQSQIIVWVSLTRTGIREWNSSIPRFPAILDTGHTHNFAIQTGHLFRWADLAPEGMFQLGYVRQADKRPPLFAADLWLHRNERGTSTLFGDPYRLKLPRGIAVYPDNANYPRLPLLGLRTLLSNQLYLTLNGQKTTVNLRTPDWRTALLDCLA